MNPRVQQQLRALETEFLKLEQAGIAPRNVFLRIERMMKARSVPISIFHEERLAPLEALVKYLREECQLSYEDIAHVLRRNPGPIGVTYRTARRKMPGRLALSGMRMELAIFSTGLSILESLATHLHDSGMSLHEVAQVLSRNDRTIWTVVSRARRKRS